LGSRLLDLLFPVRCAGCGVVGELFCGACRACVQPIPQPICPRCGRPAQDARRCDRCCGADFHVAAVRAAAVYAEPLSRIIHAFKYDRQPALGAPLGGLLADYWCSRPVTVDVVIPVPLHRQRQRERGFNQAQLLAEELCRNAGLPLLQPGLLTRQRNTRQQVHLGRDERQDNVAGAFLWSGPELGGASALLIDDVMTTGATLEACGAALHAAGAGRVWALTVARALGDQP
jgi:ComF family protein